MSPRIERHEVSEGAIAEATEDFLNRISRKVHGEQHGLRSGIGWEIIAEELQDYAGARSVQAPHAETDIKAALYSAAEARLGSLMLDCAPSGTELSVDISYTGTGVSYSVPEDEYETPLHGEHPPYPGDWTEMAYLSVISAQQESYKGPLVSLASHFEEDRVLQRALTFYLYPDLGAEREQLEGYVGSALKPFFASLGQDQENQHPDLGKVDTDLLFLHSLLSRNEEAFWLTMVARLAWFRDNRGDDVQSRTLLPTAELAFAALAVQAEGWEMPFESDYLPRYLVEGPRTEVQRVGPYGADKDPEAIRALAEGPLVVERPAMESNPSRTNQTAEEQFEYEDEELTEIWRPEILRSNLSMALTWSAGSELMSLRFHSIVDPKARHPRQLAAFTYASQYSAAKFACAAANGDTVDVTIGGTTAPMRTFEPDSDTSETGLLMALEHALMSGSRERVETLLAHPEGFFLRSDEQGSRLTDRYRRAFLTYLRAEVARGWVPISGISDECAYPEVREELDGPLEELADPHSPNRLHSSAVLFSQLVAGDQEGFNLALADRLEKHREAYSYGRMAKDPDGLINTHVLALACLARAKGWEIQVESDYLPKGVLERAAVMFE